jgi:Protein of unknown function (DUF1254)
MAPTGCRRSCGRSDMYRLILKYAYPITAVILVIFAWVIYRRIAQGWSEIITLAIAAVTVWVLGAPIFIYLWPRLTVNGFKRAIVKRGFGGGPIPVNTLCAEPRLSSEWSAGSLMGTGTDDVLYLAGWLDLNNGRPVLHVPDMAGRYNSLQFTDPSSSANFADVGKQATGTKGRRLPAQRARLGGNGTWRHDTDLCARQFRSRHRPGIRRRAPRSTHRIRAAEANTASVTESVGFQQCPQR